mgnify:CR=1 FL=1
MATRGTPSTVPPEAQEIERLPEGGGGIHRLRTKTERGDVERLEGAPG